MWLNLLPCQIPSMRWIPGKAERLIPRLHEHSQLLHSRDKWKGACLGIWFRPNAFLGLMLCFLPKETIKKWLYLIKAGRFYLMDVGKWDNSSVKLKISMEQSSGVWKPVLHTIYLIYWAHNKQKGAEKPYLFFWVPASQNWNILNVTVTGSLKIQQ